MIKVNICEVQVEERYHCCLWYTRYLVQALKGPEVFNIKNKRKEMKLEIK